MLGPQAYRCDVSERCAIWDENPACTGTTVPVTNHYIMFRAAATLVADVEKPCAAAGRQQNSDNEAAIRAA